VWWNLLRVMAVSSVVNAFVGSPSLDAFINSLLNVPLEANHLVGSCAMEGGRRPTSCDVVVYMGCCFFRGADVQQAARADDARAHGGGTGQQSARWMRRGAMAEVVLTLVREAARQRCRREL
jgi:hypothetical protein